MKKVPQKHHYVSQFHLRGFKIDNKNKIPQVYVYSKKDIARTPYIAAVKDVACVNGYNKTRINDKDDYQTVEGMLSDFETLVSQTIAEVVDCHNFSDENRYILAFFILFSKMRAPSARKMLNDFLKNNLEDVAEMNFVRNNFGLKGAFKDNFSIEITNNFSIGAMFYVLQNERHILNLMSMKFSLLKASQNLSFMCSDSPVSYYLPKHNGVSGAGLLHSELEIFTPLNKKYGLLCCRENNEPYIELNNSKTIEFNRRTIVSASDYIYSDRFDETIKELIQDNSNEFSGWINNKLLTTDGVIYRNAFIPVTDKGYRGV